MMTGRGTDLRVVLAWAVLGVVAAAAVVYGLLLYQVHQWMAERQVAAGRAAAAATSTASSTTGPLCPSRDEPHDERCAEELQRRNYVANRAPVQPAPLTAAQQARAEAAAKRAWAALAPLRSERRYDVETVRRALVAAGFPDAGLDVRLNRTMDGTETAGWVVFGLRAGRGCVLGEHSPRRTAAQADGPRPEVGCGVPPKTH